MFWKCAKRIHVTDRCETDPGHPSYCPTGSGESCPGAYPSLRNLECADALLANIDHLSIVEAMEVCLLLEVTLLLEVDLVEIVEALVSESLKVAAAMISAEHCLLEAMTEVIESAVVASFCCCCCCKESDCCYD